MTAEKFLQQIDGDLIISLKQSQGSLISPNMKVYVKKNGSHKQIGLIQDFELKAKDNETLVECSITFPKESGLSENLKKNLKEYIELLSNFKNITINLV